MRQATEEIDVALCRSALYEALALGFRAPTAETVARLASADSVEALHDMVAPLDRLWGSNLRSLVRGLLAEADLDALTRSFHRFFGHTARGLVPPYETEYGEESVFQPMQEMSDLAAFYRAFGLAMAPCAHERPDHLSCECEFLAILCRKEAYALERDDQPMLEGTKQALRLFLRDHLGRWAPGFGKKVAREDPEGFFGTLGLLCAEFIAHECREAGVPAGPELLRLRSAESPNLPMGCGVSSQEELLQIQMPASRPGPAQ
jgi:DMSO reductase family type II enzyme chaperone